MSGSNDKLISVHPEDLRFPFEPEKQSYCDLKIANNTEHYVAFKVKTTSPKKYFVRPNTGILGPHDPCTIRVTLQAQGEYPPNMQCNDKFLLQSTKVQLQSQADDIPPDTFTKEGGRRIEEFKLKVFYISTRDTLGRSKNESSRINNSDSNNSLKDVKDEQTRKVQPELDTLKRQRNRKEGDSSFFLAFTIMVALVGIGLGLLLNFVASI